MSVRVLLCGGLLVLAALAVAADQPPAIGPEVSVEPIDGEIVMGRLRIDVVRLETDHGVHEIRGDHIRRITFKPPGSEHGKDVVEFTDKEHVQGRLLTDRFELEKDGKILAFSASALREIKLTAKPPAGFWALAIGLITLSAMEIVLGIDNIIFLAIVAGKLPEHQQPQARRLGLIAALGTRILLLLFLSFLLGLTKPVFTIPEIPYLHDIEAREVSLRDLILLAGGLFLIGKSVREIHEKLEAAGEAGGARPARAASFGGVLIQIAILDIVFSLDSVITAIGMVDVVWVMVVAMVIAMAVMLVFAGRISDFVAKHPTIKVLALAFLILIGVLLVAESLGQHINKGYIYFAMAFAIGIEMLNLRLRKKPATETVTI